MESTRTPRNPAMLFFGITGLILIAAYVNVVRPDTALYIAGFFILLLATLMCLGIYTLKNVRRAIMISSAVIIFLFLRIVDLRNPLYAVLLTASVIALEYVWKDHK